MRQSPQWERIEPRHHFAVGGLDPSWHFSQAAIDTAARTPLLITDVIPARNGRTYLLATGDDLDQTGPARRSYIVALTPDGSPDEAFNGTGVVATPFASTASVPQYSPDTVTATLTVGGDDRLYLAGTLDHRVVRYRAVGTRDKAFGTNGSISLSITASPKLLAVASDRLLTTGVNDGRVRVIQIDSTAAREVYSTPLPPPDVNYGPVVDGVWLVPHPVGYTLLYGEQYFDQTYHEPVDPTGFETGYTEIRGELTAVQLLGGTFVESGRRTYDTGGFVDVNDVVPTDTGGVLAIGGGFDAPHRRVLVNPGDLGKPTRTFVDPPVSGLNVGTTVFLPDGRIAVGGKRGNYANGYTPVLRLANADGTPAAGFGDNGSVTLGPKSRDVFGGAKIELAEDGSLLVGSYVKAGPAFTLDVRRLTPTAAPLAAFIAVRPPRANSTLATIEVRYSATAGIVNKTIDGADLRIRSDAGEILPVTVFSTSSYADGSVAVRYQFDASRGHAFRVDLRPGQVAATDGTVNAGRRLTTLRGLAVDLPTIGNADVQPLGSQYVITLQYRAGSGVSLGSVKASTLEVRGPNGVRLTATVGNARRIANGNVAVYYRLPGRGPRGTWPASDDGVYTAVLLAGTIQNGLGASSDANQRVITWTVDATADFPPYVAVAEDDR